MFKGVLISDARNKTIPRKKIAHETLNFFQIIIAKIMGRSISMAAAMLSGQNIYNAIKVVIEKYKGIFYSSNFSAAKLNTPDIYYPGCLSRRP